MYKNNVEKNDSIHDHESQDGIAVIGMSGRFPGAKTVEEFWNNISSGTCSIKMFDKQELIDFGVNEEYLSNPNYVSASGFVEDQDKFDEKFFGYLPLEASVLAPQHRIFLETTHEALENAGYTSGKYEGSIGVFAGTGESSYFTNHIYPNHELVRLFGLWESQIATSPHLLVNKVSYKLNLTGPSLNINTACSTSLVSVVVACENLENFKCDMAIAGGIHLMLPSEIGYIYREGSILSADGYCRTFDKDATGTVPGSGVGVVVLKRLKDALSAGDNILAVIKGFAVNNDGSDKAGFTAPSVEGQRKCIIKAQTKASVLPHTINYIEAHGTGTPLGDSIEIQALKEAFSQEILKKESCALGSVKSNIGHADVASGIIGLIKVILCLKNKKLVPHIGARSALLNEEFEDSPFFINTKLTPWQRVNSDTPLRAGVSSFGIGGTNAHIIVEEADLLSTRALKLLDKNYIFSCSAKTTNALDALKHNLLRYMKETLSPGKTSESEFANFIYTLHMGREDHLLRLALPCVDLKNAIELLENSIKEQKANIPLPSKTQGIVFMFPGQATQYVNVARKLYENEPFFKSIVDKCCEEVYKNHQINIKNIMFVNYKIKNDNVIEPHTQYDQLSLFIIEYSLAALLINWGIIPTAMIGHSLGEYVAACLSGVVTLSEALKLIFWRGKFMQMEEKGSMLAVPLSQRDMIPFLNNQVSLAAINAPSLCVVSGNTEGISKFQASIIKQLEAKDLKCKLLDTTHAFHSFMMEGAAKKFKEVLKDIEFKEPEIPYISNVTGMWVSHEEIRNSQYWIDHLCRTVKFSSGIRTLQDSGIYTYVEVGPGNILSSLVRLHHINNNSNNTIQMLQKNNINSKEEYNIYTGLADLWIQGAHVNWPNFYATKEKCRIPLPTYPFEKKRHWIDKKINQNLCTLTKDHFEEQGLSIIKNFVKPQQKSGITCQGARNETERDLVKIWEAIFSAEPIGIFDNFFELGGHSLTAIQLISIIRKKFIIEIPIKHIFENPTIAELAKCIQLAKREKKHSILPPIIAKTQSVSAPLSFIQEQFWFLEKIARGDSVYNLSTMFWLEGKVDIDALRHAFNMLIKRHTVLGSSFELIGGELVQIAKDDLDPLSLVEYYDLSNFPKEKQKKELEKLNRIEANKPFNLSKGPLIRSQLISLNTQKHVLVVSVHHAACDGWSLNILFKELSELHNAYKANRNPNLPSLPVQYSDYAIWQRSSISKEITEQQLAYWKTKLNGIPSVLKLPLDKPRPQKQTYKGAFYYFSLSRITLKNLKSIAEKYDVTFFMTILSAFSLLLHYYCKERDIVIGTPIANRHYTNVENLIGCFLNMLSLRIDCDGDPSFVDLLQQVRKVTLEAYENRDVPFRQIINHLQIERSLSWNPIFQVIMYIQTNDTKLFQLDGIEAKVNSQEAGAEEIGTSKIDLTLWLQEEGKLSLGFEYATDLFEASTIRKMAKDLKKLLQSISINPNQLISELQSKLTSNMPGKKKLIREQSVTL